jgi:hypothetical protein
MGFGAAPSERSRGMDTHLRATNHPAAWGLPGRRQIFVVTECGELVPTHLVDNETASCVLCNIVDRGYANVCADPMALLELGARAGGVFPPKGFLTSPWDAGDRK